MKRTTAILILTFACLFNILHSQSRTPNVSKKEQISLLQASLDSLKNENFQLRKKADSISFVVSFLREEIRYVKKANDSLSLTLEKIKHINSTLEYSIDSLKENIQKLKTNVIKTNLYEWVQQMPKEAARGKDEILSGIENSLKMYFFGKNLFAFDLIVYRADDYGNDKIHERGGNYSGVGEIDENGVGKWFIETGPFCFLEFIFTSETVTIRGENDDFCFKNGMLTNGCLIYGTYKKKK